MTLSVFLKAAAGMLVIQTPGELTVQRDEEVLPLPASQVFIDAVRRFIT